MMASMRCCHFQRLMDGFQLIEMESALASPHSWTISNQ